MACVRPDCSQQPPTNSNPLHCMLCCLAEQTIGRCLSGSDMNDTPPTKIGLTREQQDLAQVICMALPGWLLRPMLVSCFRTGNRTFALMHPRGSSGCSHSQFLGLLTTTHMFVGWRINGRGTSCFATPTIPTRCGMSPNFGCPSWVSDFGPSLVWRSCLLLLGPRLLSCMHVVRGF